MKSTFVIRLSDLNIDFIKSIKRIFKKDKEIQITISSNEDFGLNKPETKEQYFSRLTKAIKNLNTQKKVVQLSEQELEEMIFKNFSK
jgi:hypothetical protein